ncbi:hypothetical protein VP01_301g2 [Puccinia sorghi]|uniref:Plastocyanin-like domain-containing protein n=1 Tax=Puccinia sorghi TaxID=27349 RepID=A0A0L6V069_9BASI|nr:hypothetical protein VP01_301g2 [Puccinia sorghi]
MSLNILPIIWLVCSLIPIASCSPLNHDQDHHAALAGSAPPQEYVLKSDFRITAHPTLRRYTLNVTETMAALDGFLRPVLAINDQIPGPLIEVRSKRKGVPSQEADSDSNSYYLYHHHFWAWVACQANEGDRLEITVINQMNISLTMHWHGIYQNGTKLSNLLYWEDGVTGKLDAWVLGKFLLRTLIGVTQCPIPPNGGLYTYKFNLDGQLSIHLALFVSPAIRLASPISLCSSHHQNLMADGINGPMIIHSPRDPLKRSVDFDHDVVLMLTDWYHNTSSEIVHEMLSEAGHVGTPAAPGANSALINGVGEWNCSYATKSERCQQVTSPPEFTFRAGDKIRFRLINAGVHAMFFYSVDEHTLNITEADSTGIYGPSDFRHLWLHNGQRYSVIIQTKKEDAGRSFLMRATMDSDCWAWVPNDIQDTAFGILRLSNDDYGTKKVSQARPDTEAWPQEFPQECLDINPNLMVPILKRSVPNSVVGSGRFEAGFGYQLVNNTQEFITRNEAVKMAQDLGLEWTRDENQRERKKFLTSSEEEQNRSGSRIAARRLVSRKNYQDVDKSSALRHAHSNKRQVKIRPQLSLPFGERQSSVGVTRLAGPPPTPVGTIGKYFVNNISWTTYPYQPVLHDLIPGGVGSINSSRVANVIYPTAEWYDLYLINIDSTGSHPYHLVRFTSELKWTRTPCDKTKSTRWICTSLPLGEDSLRLKNSQKSDTILTIRFGGKPDTVVVPPASYVVIRLHADIPGAWIIVRFFTPDFEIMGYNLLSQFVFILDLALSHWMAHVSHIYFNGFAGVVVVQPDVISRFVIPEDNLALCDARTEPLDSIEPGA